MTNGSLCSACRVAVVTAMLLGLPAAAHAAGDSYPFIAGSSRLSISFGGATAFNRNYSVFGVGLGYFVSDGIEAGLDAELWSGYSPRIEQVSPQARIILSRGNAVRPYVGAFYRRTHIEGYRDLDTLGARAGACYGAGPRAYFGLGLVEDIHLNCDRTVYSNCAETYPEILFAIIF